MNSIYFEEKGEALLEKIGMPKAEFARKMGIQRQNVRALFKSKDLRVIRRAADVMGVPWIFLVGYAEEPDIYQLPIPSYEEFLDFAKQYPGEYEVPEDASSCDSFEIAPEDIPTGDSVEDRRARQEIISQFYHYSCPGLGDVCLMVGVRRQDKMKVQYCITALTPVMKRGKKKQGSLK